MFVLFLLHKPLATLFVEKAQLENKLLAVPQPGNEFAPLWQSGLRSNARVAETCLSKPGPAVYILVEKHSEHDSVT